MWLHYLQINEDDITNPIRKKEYEVALKIGIGSNPIDYKNV